VASEYRKSTSRMGKSDVSQGRFVSGEIVSARAALPPVKDLIVALALVAAGALLFALLPALRTPIVHTILDTSISLTSAVLAWVLWVVGGRSGKTMHRLLAVAFIIVSAVELVHTFTAIKSSENLIVVDVASLRWLAATWGPSSYLAPIALGAILLLPKSRAAAAILAGVTILAAAGLFTIFGLLPRFETNWFLGISRPTLLLSPLLWLVVGFGYWRRREEPVARAVAYASTILVVPFLVMCFAHTTYDAPALIGHLGKLACRLFLLTSVMQIAASDITRRKDADEKLRLLNRDLEAHVADRTALLTEEMDARAQAETRLRTQVGRLNLHNRITEAIGDRVDLKSIYQIVVRSLEDQMPVDFACILTHDGGMLSLSNASTKSAEMTRAAALLPPAFPVANETLARCVAGELVYEPDAALSVVPFPRLMEAGLASVVFSPLRAENRTFGLLIVARRAVAGFDSGDCEFLSRLSIHVALAAHQAQIYGSLQKAYDELRQTQQSAMQQERLSALGQMASGIAHDINNAISPVTIYAETILETEPGLTARSRGFLETIRRAARDVAETVGRLREFYRADPDSQLGPVDLNALLPQTIDLTRARWSDMPLQRGIVIRAVADPAPGLPLVAGVESEIRDALTNFVFNAVDALPSGGTIVLRTRVVAGDKPKVALEVVDDGVGMDDLTRRRCLEPFFTTKGERGTGLGLAMVYGAAERQNASIEIDSAPGQGSTFRLLFDVMADAVAEAPVPRLEPSAPSGPLRILLVDDDAFVRESTQVVLEIGGHVAVEADGGEAGLKLFDEALARGEPFDVVMTDLGMPGMDGSQLAKAIKALSPTTPIVLLTGWGKRRTSDADLSEYVDFTLAKPPELKLLLQTLADAAQKFRRPAA
jgi:signal transduction histidine kinase/ActR/RegA family two-component response regulator